MNGVWQGDFQPSTVTWCAVGKNQEDHFFSDGEEQSLFDPPPSQVSPHCLEKYLIPRTDVSSSNVFLLGAVGES